MEQFGGSLWRSVAMNYTGFAAKLGGSTSVEWPNASPGLYGDHTVSANASDNVAVQKVERVGVRQHPVASGEACTLGVGACAPSRGAAQGSESSPAISRSTSSWVL